MGRYDDQARRRIRAWLAGNPDVTLTKLGQAAGYNQPWATRWLGEEYDASLDALSGMYNLVLLDVQSTRVTDAALRRLEHELPNVLDVEMGAGQPTDRDQL